MYKIENESCRKCGSDTSINWIEPEKSSGMDIAPLKRGGMERICSRCGFSEFIDALDERVEA